MLRAAREALGRPSWCVDAILRNTDCWFFDDDDDDDDDAAVASQVRGLMDGVFC